MWSAPADPELNLGIIEEWFVERWRAIVAQRPDWKVDDFYGNSEAADMATRCLKWLASATEHDRDVEAATRLLLRNEYLCTSEGAPFAHKHGEAWVVTDAEGCSEVFKTARSAAKALL